MRTALSLAALALLLAVTGGILVGVYDVHRDLSALHGVIDDAGASLRAVNQTLSKMSTAADTLNTSADAQQKNLKTIGDDAAKTGTDTRRLVAHMDRILTRINTQTLGQLEAQIAGNGNELQTSIKTLGLTIAKVGDTADGATEATKMLTARIADRIDDPRIDEIIGHFNTVSGSLDTISVDAVAMSADMRLEVHRMAQPPSKLHTALNIAWTTAKFGSLFIP
jgi:hypothetical protein